MLNPFPVFSFQWDFILNSLVASRTKCFKWETGQTRNKRLPKQLEALNPGLNVLSPSIFWICKFQCSQNNKLGWNLFFIHFHFHLSAVSCGAFTDEEEHKHFLLGETRAGKENSHVGKKSQTENCETKIREVDTYNSAERRLTKVLPSISPVLLAQAAIWDGPRPFSYPLDMNGKSLQEHESTIHLFIISSRTKEKRQKQKRTVWSSIRRDIFDHPNMAGWRVPII